jgi:zinc transport system substrate-binding protein
MRKHVVRLGSLWLASIGLATVALAGRSAVAEPAVVASIMPVHALVAGVMDGVGAPAIVVRGASSPHSYALKPSQARLLERAKIVFWIGPIYETFLDKTLMTLASKGTVVPLMGAPGVTLLPTRGGGVWEDDDELHGHAKDAKPANDEADGHLFLDPANAKAMTRSIAATLAKADAANAARYEANAASLLTRLDTLDLELRTKLSSARERPYLVFHDAYQYFEKRYGLKAAGSITVTPDRRPGARRLSELRKRIASAEAVCVFSEPQFEPSLVKTVVEGTNARTGVLDPLGADLTPGPNAYFAMMRNLAKAFAGCLAG